MGKWEIRPIATPKPLIRSLPKVVYVIMSLISTDVQNIVTITQGFFSRMREIAHQNIYWTSFLGSSNTPHPRPPNRFSRVIRQTSLSNDLSWYSIKCFLQIYKSKVELLSFHPYFSCIRRTVKIASVVHFPGRDCILISCRKYDGCPPFWNYGIFVFFLSCDHCQKQNAHLRIKFHRNRIISGWDVGEI